MEDIVILKKLILQKLIRADIWGGKHIPLDFVRKGIPGHYMYHPKRRKAFEKVLKEFVNNGWIIILLKRTGKGSGEHISLNPRKVGEIRQFLEEK